MSICVVFVVFCLVEERFVRSSFWSSWDWGVLVVECVLVIVLRLWLKFFVSGELFVVRGFEKSVVRVKRIVFVVVFVCMVNFFLRVDFRFFGRSFVGMRCCRVRLFFVLGFCGLVD